MITTKFLKDIYTEARPIIERHLDDAELLAGMREVVAAQGGDWSSLKALITADVKDGRDEAGDGKRVKKILDKADYSAAYADMLGLANMNDGNNSADEPFDPETGEILEDRIPKPATEAAAAARENSSIGKRSGGDASLSRGAGRGDGMASAPMHANVSEGVTAGRVPALNIPREEGAAHAEEAAPAIRAVNAAPTRAPDMEIPAFLRRTKPPPELVE